MTLSAWLEEIRRAYQRFDAYFELDQHGELRPRLNLDLEGESVANRSHTYGNELWEFENEGYMRRRDASMNDYEIDESDRRYRSPALIC